MKEVVVELQERSYPIRIDAHVLDQLGKFMQEVGLKEKVLIVSDDHVAPYYLASVQKSLNSFGFKTYSSIVPSGEQSKSLAVAERLYTEALRAHLDRQSTIVALGGGVVGDLAGFVAATYMRGIPFVQCPTSLLSQVDSSVGGKVAVNHPMAKNIIGSFYQPRLVCIDVSTLTTLSSRELASGLAEVVKHGVILDEEFYYWLENNIQHVLSHSLDALIHVVETNCRLKASIVMQDEKEKGLRAILNFGHTIGHAIEAATNFEKYTHGEAVSIGMVYEMMLSAGMGYIPSVFVERLISLLVRIGLPYKLEDVDVEHLMLLMSHDKKNIGGKLTFILPTSLGKAIVCKDVDPGMVRKVLIQAR